MKDINNTCVVFINKTYIATHPNYDGAIGSGDTHDAAISDLVAVIEWSISHNIFS